MYTRILQTLSCSSFYSLVRGLRPCAFHCGSIVGGSILHNKHKMEPEPKKPCVPKRIGTHSGTFHCDEALACFMLRLLPEYKGASITRTRDPELLKPCDVVVDVGGVYDPSCHRYDHHQRTFSETMRSLTSGHKPWTTKLSSAGLVYLHFGHRVIATIAGTAEGDSVTDELFDCVYSNFIEEVDAVDNGIDDKEGVPRYKVTSTISSRVGRLNPAWNDPDQSTDAKFQLAMELVGKEFTECVLARKDVWLPARNIVQQAIEERHKVHNSGEIIRLQPFCPWKGHLFEVEEKLSLSPSIKFVLYKEKESERWRVQAVPIHAGTFENRVSLPDPWCGLRDKQLSQLSGIPGCVFVHANGFIGGNETYSGVLQMAAQALES